MLVQLIDVRVLHIGLIDFALLCRFCLSIWPHYGVAVTAFGRIVYRVLSRDALVSFFSPSFYVLIIASVVSAHQRCGIYNDA